MSKPKKANFFVKTLRNIDPASSTFTFETRVVITVFVVPGKVTVQIGDGGEFGIKIEANISFIQFHHEYLLSLKSEIMSIKEGLDGRWGWGVSGIL